MAVWSGSTARLVDLSGAAIMAHVATAIGICLGPFHTCPAMVVAVFSVATAVVTKDLLQPMSPPSSTQSHEVTFSGDDDRVCTCPTKLNRVDIQPSKGYVRHLLLSDTTCYF